MSIQGADTIAHPQAIITRSVKPPVYVGVRPYLQMLVVLALLTVYQHFYASDPLGGQLYNLWLFYASIVVGFWLVFGAAGQFAFSQAAFVGLGGYAGVLWAGYQNFWIGCLITIGICGAVATAFGLIVIRTGHFYFAITTLGISQIATIVFTNWTGLTKGQGGTVIDIPPISIFGHLLFSQSQVFWVLLGFFGLLTLLRIWYQRSPAYRETIAFRDNPRVAATLGVPNTRLRLSTFILGSISAGLAGLIYVHWTTFNAPTVYSLDLAVAILLMLVLGGTDSLWGPLLGAWFYTYLFQILPLASGWQSAIYGGLLMVVILLLPQGLGGVGAQILSLARGRSWASARAGVPARLAWARERMLSWVQPGASEGSPGVTRADGGGSPESTPGVESATDLADLMVKLRLDMSEESRRSTGAVVLEARDIRVAFGGVQAVSGVSLTVHDGEILGLVGPNGSGKSSLLNALTGLVPAGGSLSVAGKRIRLGDPKAIHAAGLMRTFQTPQTFRNLTCQENVLLATTDRSATGISAAWLGRPRLLAHEHRRWERAVTALDDVRLGHLAHRTAGGLAYGEERLLELARALAGEPVVLLLDEPSAGLTAAETAQLAERLSAIRDRGVGMILVDHKLDFLAPLCERIIILDIGNVIAEGTPQTVFQDERVIDVFLGVAET